MTTEQYSIGYDAGYQDGFDAALAEPVKQEPVAWLIPGSITGDKKLAEANGDYATPLYAAPVQPVKQEPVGEMIDKNGYKGAAWYCEPPITGTQLYAAPVEPVKHEVHQEPVADTVLRLLEPFMPVDAKAIRAEREWVDLTDDEIWDVFISKDWTGEPLQLMSAVITAFKEKNK